MPSMSASGEDYLRAHHDDAPGRMSDVFHLHRFDDGRTSYEVIADLIPDARSVLDLGCADGGLMRILSGRGVPRLAGIDISDAELEVARRDPVLAGSDLRLGRAQELPWPDGSFDAVAAHMTFMLMDDVEQVAAEVARVLTSGGVFVVAIGGPVPGGALEAFRALAPKYLADSTPPLGDPRARTREGLDEILAPAGFAPVVWHSLVIDRGGPAGQTWDDFMGSLYGMETLSDGRLAEFRAEFLAAAGEFIRSDGYLPAESLMNFAVASRSDQSVRPVT